MDGFVSVVDGVVGVVTGVVGDEVGDVFNDFVEDVVGDEVNDKIPPSPLVVCGELDGTGGNVLVVDGMVGVNIDAVLDDGA